MSVLDLTSIKDGIKEILDTANSVAADYDLSTNMNRLFYMNQMFYV